ncbi:cytochrome c family protein [Bosea sp. RCC_152_1]|uniref:c-type cytochrome n=1 Tax=Bosea sp. RCC_152_1 TaxID=3239228 RepID=UPI003524A492
MRLGRLEIRLLPLALVSAAYVLGRYTGRQAARKRDRASRAAGEALEPVPSPRRLGRPALLAGAVLLVCAAGTGAVFLQSSWQADRIGHALTGGDPARAPALLRRYGCGGCHTISALNGADGKVAAPLDAFAQRVFIGGAARNSPDNLVRWIVSPQSLSPRSAMPATGITPEEARDVAAFLYAH